MTQKAILKELKEQDKILHEIFSRREELAKIAKEQGCYNKVYDKLFADHLSHFNF